MFLVWGALSEFLSRRLSDRRVVALHRQLDGMAAAHSVERRAMANEVSLLRGRLGFLCLRYHEALETLGSFPLSLRDNSDQQPAQLMFESFSTRGSVLSLRVSEDGVEGVNAEPVYATVAAVGSVAGAGETGLFPDAQAFVEEGVQYGALRIEEIEEIDQVGFVLYFITCLVLFNKNCVGC